jgi:hypothetical protein
VLLYRSSDAELATYAQDDGDDIVFVDRYNVTQYKHEIEKFNSSTGELVAWVKVTSISSTEDTILYMYYGNSQASSASDYFNTFSIGGTGADGNLTVSSVTFNINVNVSGGRTYADGIAYRVNAPADGVTSLTRYSGSVTLSNGIAVGDEVLIGQTILEKNGFTR